MNQSGSKQSRNQRKKARAQVANVIQPLKGQMVQQTAPRRKNKKTTQVGQVLRDVGGIAGGLFGQAGLGRNMGAAISRIFGQGDYTTNNPATNSLMGGVPSFSPLTSGVRIRHREYLKDVSSSVTFSSNTYYLNPGLSSTFPWLSQLANNFEEYKIHGMVFYLNTMSGASVASTNTALGLWGAVTQYDPLEVAFTNKQQCEAYVGAQSAVPSQSIMHGIECKPQSNVLDRMYVRSGQLTASGDSLKFYDWGKTQIFTQGSQAVSTIGELWIAYDVEFFKPRLPTGGLNVYMDWYPQGTLSSATSWFAASSTSGNFKPIGGSIGTSIIPGSNNIVFPSNAIAGVYKIDVYFTLATAPQPLQFSSGTPTVSGSMANTAYFWSGGTLGYHYATGTTSGATSGKANFHYSCVVRKTSTDEGSVTLQPFLGTVSAGTSNTDLMITLLSPNLSPGLSELEDKPLDQTENLELRKFLKMIKSNPEFMEAFHKFESNSENRTIQEEDKESDEEVPRQTRKDSSIQGTSFDQVE